MNQRVTFSAVVKTLMDAAGEKYSLDKLKEWVCNEVFLGEYDRSNFYNCVKKDKTLGKNVLDYYEDSLNIPLIADDVKDFYMVRLPLQSKLRPMLEELVYSDASLTENDRLELLTGSDEEITAKILRFSIIRQKTAGNNGSPYIEHLFDNIEVPHIAQHFIGREKELAEIENRLSAQNLLYVSGIGGVGKSELTQEYARQHRKQYQNILFFPYHNSLRETFCQTGQIGTKMQPEDEQYQQVVKLLKSLKSDSLILIDDLNKLPEEDADFALLRRLKCHILVTTRFKFDINRTYELQTLSDPQDLLRLFYSYCPDRGDGRTDEEDVLYLVDLVHGHTQSILMLALTVNEGFGAVWQLSEMIREYGLDFPNEVCIATQKDDKDLYEPFFILMKQLFSVQNLNDSEKNTLQNFSIMPDSGVTKRKFAEWSGKTAEVQYLIRLGWFQEDIATQKVYMHGIVRDMIHEVLHPAIETCKIMIDSMLWDCRRIEAYSYDDEKEWQRDLREINFCAEGVIRYLREDTVLCALYFTLFSTYSHIMQNLIWGRSFVEHGFVEDDFDRISMEYMMQANLKLLMGRYPDYRRVLNDIKPNCDGIGGEYTVLWALANEKLEAQRELYNQLGRQIQLEKKVASPMLKKRITPRGKHSKGKQRGGHRGKHNSLTVKERLTSEKVVFKRKKREGE